MASEQDVDFGPRWRPECDIPAIFDLTAHDRILTFGCRSSLSTLSTISTHESIRTVLGDLRRLKSSRLSSERQRPSPIFIGDGLSTHVIKSTLEWIIHTSAPYKGYNLRRRHVKRKIPGSAPSKTGVQGFLNGAGTTILADTGAEVNFIGETYAEANDILVDRSPKYERDVEIANGNYMRVVGKAWASFSFVDDPNPRVVEFDVAHHLVDSILFGNPFLQEEDLLGGRFMHRLARMQDTRQVNNVGAVNQLSVGHNSIRTAFAKRSQHCTRISSHNVHQLPSKILWNPRPMGPIVPFDVVVEPIVNCYPTLNQRLPVHASFGGKKVRIDAFPDTGAGTNIVSESFVKYHGLQPLESNETFEFPDGTTEKSLGWVRMWLGFADDTTDEGEDEVSYINCENDPTWYTQDTLTCEDDYEYFEQNPSLEGGGAFVNFEVMRDCSHNVILGHNFVFNNYLYSNNKHRLVSRGANTKSGLNLVTIVSQRDDQATIQTRQNQLMISERSRQLALQQLNRNAMQPSNVSTANTQTPPQPNTQAANTGSQSLPASGQHPLPTPSSPSSQPPRPIPLNNLTQAGQGTLPLPAVQSTRHRYWWQRIWRS
ncbi:hypothetical protein FN846DRAFT_918651 [Sphaerosporella brunnea]|uniref:Uncharacterized protein n=1 Tax=Sphaerosporella brunnea TaxID=1250544 RepID=A0A5J5EZG3_9PEZI|nr:hypothetical protein FN846DRAFT_918651 [Sphaerosporella brunnea]